MATAIPTACLASSAIRCRNVETELQPRCVGRLSLQRCHLPVPPSLHGVSWAQFPRFGGVGSEEAPIEGLASVRRSNGTCGFPAYRFPQGCPGAERWKVLTSGPSALLWD